MKKQLISVFATLLLGTPRVHGDVVDKAYEQFRVANYSATFNLLLKPRFEGKPEPSLRMDFMLAVSGCHLDQYGRALGGYLLSVIPDWYDPLSTVDRNSVSAQALGCPPTLFPGAKEVALLDGKYDTVTDSLAPGRSKIGAGALPRADIASPRGMAPLVDGRNYRNADYGYLKTESAYACAERCAADPRCVVMTYIKSQKRCWLKKKVNAITLSDDMVSAVKRSAALVPGVAELPPPH